MTGRLARQQWGTRIEIRSETSSRVYIVSEKLEDGQPTGTYGCSCPGWISRRNCKHLRSMSLTSCAAPITPAAKGEGTGDNSSFRDDAFKHYDVAKEGFGNWRQWFELAEKMARGRQRYTPPPRRQATGLAVDMALLGLTEMPPDARGLLSAMRRQARVVHPDYGGTNEAFTAMFAAYERLLRRYPK